MYASPAIRLRIALAAPLIIALLLVTTTPSHAQKGRAKKDRTKRADSAESNPIPVPDALRAPDPPDFTEVSDTVDDPEPDPDEFVVIDTEPELDYDDLLRRVAYPEIARLNGIEGMVHVQVLVGTDGAAKKYRVLHYDNKLLEAAAVEAVMATTFTPATLAGKPEPYWLTLPVRFSLDVRIRSAAHPVSPEESGEGMGEPPIAPKDDPEPEPDEFVEVESEPHYDHDALQNRLVYPEMARRNGIEGTVVVQVLIGKDGRPQQSRIVASDNKIFDEAAIDAVMGAQFTPAIQNNLPVAVWISVPVRFALR